ncbi:MAG: CbrC family protein [Caldilineaceae bacterium]|nr:CbrC family protein [Caldilineaceae bacterium]
MNISLPTFKYHPDPIATGSVIKSDTVCSCCSKPHGFFYVNTFAIL